MKIIIICILFSICYSENIDYNKSFQKLINSKNNGYVYGENNSQEQKILFEYHIFNQNILTKVYKYGGQLVDCKLYEQIEILLIKGNVFALSYITSDIFKYHLDGERQEFYFQDYILYSLQYFPNINNYLTLPLSEKYAKRFCASDYFASESPIRIFKNIEKNGVYKFINKVKKIDGCYEKLIDINSSKK